MNITRAIGVTLAVCATLALSPVATGAGAPGERTTVNVTAQYTGKGTVDDGHRIWIWLFDSPDFTSGQAMPLAEQSLAENGTTAVFSGIGASQVWIAVAYDERGGFMGSAPPPSGAPVSTYIENGAPAPVAPGETADGRLVFDDSIRMP
jgi:hypothetical protein